MMLRQRIGVEPRIHRAFWSLAIMSAGSKPLIWSFNDLQQYARTTLRLLHVCSAGSLQSVAPTIRTWRGIGLRTLLAEAAANAELPFMRVHCADGYSTILPRSSMSHALVAFEQDGAQLTVEAGFPARLVVPGRFAYKHAKWVESFTLTEEAEGGFWEDRGWDRRGRIAAGSTLSAHHDPQDGMITIEGLAYAQQDVLNVEVSANDSAWFPAQIVGSDRDDAGSVLCRWHCIWQPPHAGRFLIQARAGLDAGHRSEPTRFQVAVEA